VIRASDDERERAVASLREHFVRGRLTIEELTARCEVALRARSRADLGRALAEMPPLLPQAILRGFVRGAALVVLTGAWALFSLVLLLAFGLTLLLGGISTVGLVAFLAIWLVPTYLLFRRWQRGLSRFWRGV
jgi:Flp pilus assembly protein TadB